jgi:hypothetical protein
LLLGQACALDRSGAPTVADGSRFDAGACEMVSCLGEGAECGSIDDGCGGTLACGECEGDLVCGAMGPNRCGDGPCMPTTCAAEGKDCGTISDGCARVLECGTCTAPATCGADNVCGCTPATCESWSAVCGNPGDGCGRTLSCGECTDPEVCNEKFACVCEPRSCEELDANCGSPGDGCGALLECGTCSATSVCRDSFRCGPCTGDSAEPNDTAPGFALPNAIDEPDVVDSFGAFTFHAVGQRDVYSFQITDPSGDGNTNSTLTLRLSGVDPGQDADLRVTFVCGGSGGTRVCVLGSPITNGCESTAGPGSAETIEVRIGCADYTADATVEVFLAGDAFTSCAPYLLERSVR